MLTCLARECVHQSVGHTGTRCERMFAFDWPVRTAKLLAAYSSRTMRSQRKRSRDEANQSPAGRKTRKMLTDISCLPESLAELVSDTCRLAALKPKAQKLLESSMQKLCKEVNELCGAEGDLSSTNEGSASEHQDGKEFEGWFVDDMETRNCFVSSPTQAAAVAYLIQSCKETGSPEQTDAPVPMKKPGMLSPRQVQMINAVQLKDLPWSVEPGDRKEVASTVVDFNAESFSGLLNSFYRHTNAEDNEASDAMEKDTKHAPKSGLPLELPGDITGDEIEIFCGKTTSWRAANVIGEEDGKIHILGYHDGGVERVKLESRLWRPIC